YTPLFRSGAPAAAGARPQGAAGGPGQDAGLTPTMRPRPGAFRPLAEAGHWPAQLSRPISRTRALCVSQPTAIRSTPVAATPGAYSSVITPAVLVPAAP